MGTRADFYIGRGLDAEWLGSIAWDGYPSGIAESVIESKDAEEFRASVKTFMTGRDDATTPEMGWPWPWGTSGTTDFAYAFDNGKVQASAFGGNWFDPHQEDGEGERIGGDEAAIFPDMSGRKNVALGGIRSGLIIISA